ncbi:MAG: hypothetical protein RIA69_20830 [Cyclobacteriaceae bacterium]
MRYWIFFIFLSAYFESFSQVSIHVGSGIGTNSGVSAEPYKNRSRSLAPVLPWMVEMNMKYFISRKGAISLIFHRKRNLKGGDILTSPPGKSIIYYSGMAYSHRFYLGSSGTQIDIGCSFLYGKERVNWQDEYWSLFGGSGIKGQGEDTFQLLQLGPFIDLSWQERQIVINVRFQITQDFLLTSQRDIFYGDAVDYQDKGDGMISPSMMLGIGVIINKEK